jgi:hypothetical protein
MPLDRPGHKFDRNVSRVNRVLLAKWNPARFFGEIYMVPGDISIDNFLLELRGKPAWGLVRTFGSMFFLEIGKPMPRNGVKKIHGEWHALFEMCHWRVESQQAMLVGSDDEQELIDATFADLKLGSIDSANVSSPSHDLRIIFSSGIRLSTFLATAVDSKDESAHWQIYCPDGNVWIAKADGSLSNENVFA